MFKKLLAGALLSFFMLGCVQGPLVDVDGTGYGHKPRTAEEQVAHDKAKQEKDERKRQEKLRKDQEKKEKEAQEKAEKEQKKKKDKDDD
jgi:sRNA-binding protein